MSGDPLAKSATLGCWRDKVDPEPLGGGITNTNFVVEDKGERFVVRIGDDIPEHCVSRINELASARAAHAAGIAPEIVHTEPGALVMRYIEGRTLKPEDVRDAGMLERILPLIRVCHQEVPRHFRGPAPLFWTFQVVRDYAATLRKDKSRRSGELPRLEAMSAELEKAVGAVRLVFGHNDLLAANLIDDGTRLWLLDWEYAGFNSPLFDLGGLASNNELPDEQERWLLDTYFYEPADKSLLYRYAAMKCASLLRESMWSMVSELHSKIDADFVAYTSDNLQRLESAWIRFQSLEG
ncbi:MAG: Thiamine kinase [Gammaproteobacteria bacterium]|nr:Thiamine kinase [Gammaproteobacteria bacterium]